jgi:hypothetical protein
MLINIKKRKRTFKYSIQFFFLNKMGTSMSFLYKLSNLISISFLKFFFLKEVIMLIRSCTPYLINKLRLLKVLAVSRGFSYHLAVIFFVYSHLIIRVIHVIFTVVLEGWLMLLVVVLGIDYNFFLGLSIFDSVTMKLAYYLPPLLSLLSFVLSQVFKYCVLSEKKITFKYLIEDKFFVMVVIYFFLYKWFC